MAAKRGSKVKTKAKTAGTNRVTKKQSTFKGGSLKGGYSKVSKERIFAFLASARAKRVLNTTKTILFVVIVGLAAISLLSTLPIRTPIKPFVVLSGSMRPTIYEGSVVFVNRGSEGLKTDDIITFIRPDDFTQNVTHRIVGEEYTDGSTVYKTRGDANNTTDAWIVRPEAIWGKAAFSIPVLGYAVNFSKTRVGVILLVVIPLILISLDEVRIIRKELLKIRKGRKSKGKISTKAIVAFLIFLLPAINSNISATSASFTDEIALAGNNANTGFWVEPTVNLITPNVGILYQYNPYTITWSAAAGSPSSTITSVDLYFSTDGGSTFPNLIAGNLPNTRSFDWIVPGVFSTAVRVRISAKDNHNLSASDDSDINFTIKSAIVINEILPSPIGNGTDNNPKPDGEWVELYNLGSVPIDVGGWVLYNSSNNGELPITISNSDNNQTPLDAGETMVPGGGFLVVYRNGDPDFNLQDVKDLVRLFNAPILGGGVLIDQHGFGGLADGVTFGRIPDGTGYFQQIAPTPGAANNILITSLQSLVSELSQELLLTPSPTPEATPSPSPTPEPTPSPEASPTPEASASASPSTGAQDSNPTAELTPEITPAPTEVPIPIPLPTPTEEAGPSPLPSTTPIPSSEPILEPAPTPSAVDVILPASDVVTNV